MKIKIMHIAQSAGGVFRYLETMVKYSDINRYDITLILSEDYIRYESYLKKYVKNIEIISIKREINLINDFNAIREISHLVKLYSPDLIYAHSSKAGALVRISCIFNKTPIIYNAHGWAFNIKTKFYKRQIYSLIERLLAYRTTKIINISKFELQSAISNKIANNSKLELIYNGIETKETDDIYQTDYILQAKLDKWENNIVPTIIGAVGRISRQKSPLDFVELAHKVLLNNSNCLFLWVGDGEDRYEMEKAIEEKGIGDKIFITGWVDNPRSYIKKFDIALLLSEWEGFGLVLAEYMLEKKPVIATRVDAIPELIEHEVNGITINVHDIDQACSSIIKYINNPLLAQKYAELSYEKVKTQFNINRVVEEHEQLYRKILGE
ncbi:glycosyltransferase [Turicibacter sanguinis]|uniref:glycosyltransferase n=1 Tax=Turicibacter sanguinis TaxID=154288 RepID=UPI0018AB6631|nr:glycosyltransferase [Turicibacter sanguinis]MDB8553976.1 glycosyltransferase [Turicibacter sanguinis]